MSHLRRIHIVCVNGEIVYQGRGTTWLRDSEIWEVFIWVGAGGESGKC